MSKLLAKLAGEASTQCFFEPPKGSTSLAHRLNLERFIEFPPEPSLPNEIQGGFLVVLERSCHHARSTILPDSELLEIRPEKNLQINPTQRQSHLRSQNFILLFPFLALVLSTNYNVRYFTYDSTLHNIHENSVYVYTTS
jgi:hypothetical protein